MEDLIKSLKIFQKYANRTYPTACEHDVLYIVGIEPDLVSQADTDELEKLGFIVNENDDGFMSYKFGSA